MNSGDVTSLLTWVQSCIPRGSAVAIMDVPVHRNAGDLFILATTERVLTQLDCRVVHRTGVRDYRVSAARRQIGRDTILLGLGGGNFGDDYPRYQALRESVVRDFPANRIVIMPQTIHFASRRALDRAAQALSPHEDLHIAVRDAGSVQIARRFSPRVTLLPDIVDALGADGSAPGGSTRQEEVLVLMRRDQERTAGAAPAEGAVDWPDVFPELLGRVAVAAAGMTVAPAAVSARLHAAWSAYAEDVLRRGRSRIQSAAHLVTDRLHAAILARLAGTPVTLRDGAYGKLAAYYETWWKDDPTIRLASRVRE